MNVFESVLLGIVEGLSEFLPISSTGHLILVSALLKLQQTDAHKLFEVTIQSGAILAVVYIYGKRLASRPDLLVKLGAAFLPTGVLGYILYKVVKSFFHPSIVSYMLIAGGVAFLVIERFLKNRPAAVGSLQDVSMKQAFTIGVIQSISMIPGVSRAGATIMGGLLVGMNRKDAAEFSFLLALPTMLAATAYDIHKNFDLVSLGDWRNILAGFITSFLFAVIAIKALLRFLATHTFIPFGIYRIAVGVLFLLFL